VGLGYVKAGRDVCGTRVPEGFKTQEKREDMTMINKTLQSATRTPHSNLEDPMSTSCSKTALQKCYRCKVAGHDIKGKVDRELRKTKHVKDQEAGWDVFICIYCISSGSCFCTPFKN